MVAPRELDPSASALAHFGSELRQFRTRAGLSQERLGEIVNYTGAFIGLVETAKRTPTRDFAERCDRAVEADGVLVRLWPLVSRSGLPKWFQGYAELEARAVQIRTYQVQVVHGLLQTEEYARAVLRPARPRDLDELTAARMARQKILSRSEPPLFWMVIDEAALRRPVANREVMRAQLRHLLSFRHSPRIVVQVLPFRSGAHAGLNGSVTIMHFAEGPDMAYSEGYVAGQMLTDPGEVQTCAVQYDLLRTAALPPDESAEFIAQILKELDERNQ